MESTQRALRVLVVEDSEDDAVLLQRELQRAGYYPISERVESAEMMAAALDQRTWDIIIADYSLPRFSAPAALAMMQQYGLDLPFIIISGTIGEEAAVAAMKAGAHDFLIKGRWARLGPAVARELREAAGRQARRRAERAEHEQRVLAEALRDTAAALSSTLEFEEVLDRILTSAGRVVAHEVANIMLLESGVARVVRHEGYEERGLTADIDGLRLTVSETPLLDRMTRSRRWIIISDTHAEKDGMSDDVISEIRSYASAPIRLKGQIVGFLNLSSTVPGFFSAQDGDRLQAFADQAGVAIENAQLYEAIRRHASELEQRVTARTAELRGANERLKELDQLKSEFVSNVSHELRTPLASIKTFVYLLEHGKVEKRAQYMMTLQREVNLLQQLIEDLLHLSRMDLGRIQPLLEPVDLNQILEELAQDRAPLFADRQLRLIVEQDIQPAIVEADRKMVIQILTNLMTNAMNYTPSGGEVKLSTGLQRAGQEEWITFSVADSGPGISPEDQSHIFQRFFRGEAARRTNVPGTGLGLAICQELVDRHHGRLTLQSAPSAGSTFTVWIPATNRPSRLPATDPVRLPAAE